MRRIALPATVLCTLAVAAGLPPPAGALTFSPCSRGSDFGCARVDVPLDRAGGLPGTISLLVERRSASVQPARGVIFAVAGGPGQSASGIATDFAAVLEPGLDTRDLVVVDQRGTGRSGLLRCPSLERLDGISRDVPPAELARAGETCAAGLGPARARYTTADSVDDFEAVRQALGVNRIVLYGVSYGTKVAEAYAKRYPDHVAGLILDSVVAPDAGDPLMRSSLAAVPRVLRALCSHGACRGIASDVNADLRRLVRRLERRPLAGSVIDRRGRSRRDRLRVSGLAQIVIEGDLDPVLRADLPGAMRAAVRGDSAPIVRDLVRARTTEAAKPEEISDGTFASTSCEELAQLWSRTTPIDQRLAQAQAVLNALPDSAFAPFDRATTLEGSTGLCLRWPTAPAAPAIAPGPLPDVPALVLDGEDDLRTPLEDARALAAQMPHAQFVVVPATGHAVGLNDRGQCVRRALSAYFGGSSVPGCPFVPRDPGPLPVPPASLHQLHAAPGVRGAAGRTLRAALRTLLDVEVHAQAPGSRDGGLRGGDFHVGRRELSLDRVVYVPGVAVSGVERSNGTVSLRVAGRAAAGGSVSVDADGIVSGRLGGRRFRVALARALSRSESPAGRFVRRSPVPPVLVP